MSYSKISDKKSMAMQKPGKSYSSGVNQKNNTMLDRSHLQSEGMKDSMAHCSQLGKPVVPKMGRGGIRS